ncbi:MAG: hydantoinase B/oxoprolinase family protein [Polaromonas sp.]
MGSSGSTAAADLPAWRAGDKPGQVGHNLVLRASGQIEALGPIGQAEMPPGDLFEIHTPGGGGFGNT